MSVDLQDAIDIARGRKMRTTADLEVYRFYRKRLRTNHPKASLAERAERLPSPFSVEEFLKEISAMQLKPKLERRLREICRVRLCHLRGVLP